MVVIAFFHSGGLNAVGNGFHAGQGGAAGRKRTQDEEQRDGLAGVFRCFRRVSRFEHVRVITREDAHHPEHYRRRKDDNESVSRDGEERAGFAQPTQVPDGNYRDEGYGERHAEVMDIGRGGDDSLHAGGDTYRGGQRVIDQERGCGR
jgi:hypothetical protein